MRILKTLFISVFIVIIALAGLVTVMSIIDRQDDYDVDLAGVEIPTYHESIISFNQGNDFSVSLPFLVLFAAGYVYVVSAAFNRQWLWRKHHRGRRVVAHSTS